MLWRSRALRVLVWLRYSDLFLPSPSLPVVTSIALSPRGSALFDLLVSRMYLVALTVVLRSFSHVMSLSGSESPGLVPSPHIFLSQVCVFLLSQALLSPRSSALLDLLSSRMYVGALIVDLRYV